MRIAQAAIGALVVNAFEWRSDWAWGLPLIVLNVVIHIVGLGLLSQRIVYVSRMTERRRPMAAFVVVVGAATLLATCLHGIEAGIWAVAYMIFGAFPDPGSSMLYSLNAITSYGHTDIDLPDHWHLLGALEALNGWLLFGMTTAFMFGMLEKVWQVDSHSPGQKSSSCSLWRPRFGSPPTSVLSSKQFHSKIARSRRRRRRLRPVPG